MGIIKQGILGGLSGKVGNVVGSSWKGINYLRALPTHVANPRTPAQQTTRLKMELVIRFLKTCTAFIRFGFSAYAVKMSAFNAATSLNLSKAVKGQLPDVELDFEQLQVSRGNLPGALNPEIEMDESGAIRFNWDDNSGEGTATGNDLVLLLAYNPTKNSSVYSLAAAKRSDLSALLEIPASFRGDDLHCYIAFSTESRMTGNQAKDFNSDSTYAGVVFTA